MKGAELMDLFICSGSLCTELIAWDINYFKAFVMVLGVHLLNRSILRCKSASCCSVYNHDDFSLVIGKV